MLCFKQMADTKKNYITSEEIRGSKKQALEFLDSHYFYAASDIYKNILENNPNDKDAHIGSLLASNKIDNEEALIKYYQDFYSAEEYELKLACDKDEKHIEEICDKFYIPDYLEKEEIRKAYEYELTFKSNVFSRKKQKEEILKLIETDEHLSWLKEKGFKEIPDIIRVYDRRFEEAEENDRNNIQRIKGEYQRFLYKAYGDVKELNKKAKEKKEEDFKDLIVRYDSSEDEDELRELSFAFEKFKDYRDGEKYIDLCLKKIEDLKAQQKDKTLRKVIENTYDEAKSALVKGKYAEAYDGFTQAISYDSDNEDAYLGVLMARTKTNDFEELFDYYKHLYEPDQYEILEACKEDTDHIEEMIEKYYLPEYLKRETIREKYSFDRTYKSCLDSRIRQEKQFKEEVETDPVFEWLKNNGSDKTRKKIKEVKDYYSLKIKESEEEDRKHSERIKNDYQRFLFKTYSSVKNLHKRAASKKEENYKQLIKSFDLAGTEEALTDLIHKLNELGEYKECNKYISLCRKKIDELKNKEKEEFVAQDVETSLIAAKAYLSNGNEDMANQNFEKVLSMDPNNPRAYLGILMVETGSKNIDELVQYYQDLYCEDEAQILMGCEEDIEHIDSMVDRYQIPGYLDGDMIRNYYAFDRSYESMTASRIDQRDQFNEEVKMNPLLAKVASGDDEEIVSFLDRVRGEYEARIVESKVADERQCESIKHIYEVYLAESDKTVLKLYGEKLKEKNDADEKAYLRNVEQFNKDLSEEELLELSERFDLDYKDGPIYVKKCKERINAIRREREKEKLETLLINGTALLESGLFLQAKERFESYLNIDSGNEEVRLKLLMAEKEVSDVDTLFAYYKNLYSEEILETKEAVEESTSHIEEMTERCFIPELLEKEEIRKHYEFDRTYESLYETRIEQKKQIEDEIELDPEFSWLKENGSPKIQAYINDLLSVYDQRIAEAEDEDDYLVRTIEKEYRSFIRNTDREVRALYNELNKELNKRIKEAERERKETERLLKEEAERQRLLELEALKKQRELEEETERKRREEEEALRRKKEEEEKALKEKIVAQEETDRRIREEKEQEERSAREKERKEKQAELKAEKKRQKEEKRSRSEEKKRLKAEEKQKRLENKQTVSVTKERKPFQLNFGLLAAALSLVLLGTLIYIYVLVPNNKYNNAVSLVEGGNYDEAIAMFVELGGYKDSEYKVKETTYIKANDLYEHHELIEAANIFNNLRFDDSEDRVKQVKDEMIKNAQIGDSILFGDYEQDGNYDNGKEMIEWIVLDKQEGSLLVISKYGIEAQKYNASSDSVDWENSSLRSWLNGRFPDNAFSRENPSDVLQTSLINYRLPKTEEEVALDELIPEEYETRDRLFLLNSSELEQYYPQEEQRVCEATEYSIENGVAANADNSCNWWLREQNLELPNTSLIVRSADGSIGESMFEITNAVRPLMWLKQE